MRPSSRFLAALIATGLGVAAIPARASVGGSRHGSDGHRNENDGRIGAGCNNEKGHRHDGQSTSHAVRCQPQPGNGLAHCSVSGCDGCRVGVLGVWGRASVAGFCVLLRH